MTQAKVRPGLTPAQGRLLAALVAALRDGGETAFVERLTSRELRVLFAAGSLLERALDDKAAPASRG
jgi:hypothetical protein